MRSLCVIFLLLFTLSAQAQFEQPEGLDTLRTDSVTMWPDTSIAFADSTAPQRVSLRRGWLFPMGIAIATCTGLLMLFTVRSR